MKYFLMIVLFMFTFSANAALDCKNAMSTVDINECAVQEQKLIENKLNDVYKKFLKKIENLDVKQKFINAQRAWIKFREADCQALYARYADGSIRGSIYLTCMQTHAEQRIKDLEDYNKPQ